MNAPPAVSPELQEAFNQLLDTELAGPKQDNFVPDEPNGKGKYPGNKGGPGRVDTRPYNERFKDGVYQVAELKSWHEMLSVAMIVNPHWSNKELAAHFGKSATWVSAIIRSDIFQHSHNKRREEYGLQAVDHIVERWRAINDQVMDQIEDALEKNEVKPETLNRLANTALGAMGYGNAKTRPDADQEKPIQIIVDEQALAAAKERRDAAQQAIEGEVVSD